MSARRPTVLLTLAAATLAAGCSALTPSEQIRYDGLVREGASPIERKDPTTAAALNVLPGFGDIYTGEWGAFVLDLLLWPVSIVWAVPQGAITAKNINKKYTVAYYENGGGRPQ